MKSKKSPAETSINLTIPTFITYTIIILSFGASALSIYNAIPRINKLEEKNTELNLNLTKTADSVKFIKIEIIDKLETRINTLETNGSKLQADFNLVKYKVENSSK